MRIHSLIFKELIKRGYSLEGNTRIWNIADSKLWYLTKEQAQGYLNLDSDSSYKKSIGQAQAEDLIQTHLSEIADRIKSGSINIVDLGCGDGTKAISLVKQLKALKNGLKVRYCPIDISSHMVSKAIENFSKFEGGEIARFQYNISDFENLGNIAPLLKNSEFKNSLFLLLGNTLGNFEIHELLYTIRSSMDRQDLFVVDTGVDDQKQEERAASYQENPKVNEWMIHIPLQLGLSRSDVKIGFRFKNSRIEAYYTLLNNKEVDFQGKKINFYKGDQIIVAIAYKYNKTDLKSYLNMHFDDVRIKISKDGAKALAVCSRVS